MKLIHLTDPHLVPPGERLLGLDPVERLDRCLDDIERWHGDAAFCVISGDLANDGQPAVYRWLAKRLRNFPLRTFLMVGNHDDRNAMRARLPDLMDDGEGFVQGIHETEHGPFLFLDTFKAGTTAGEYCDRRQDWLRARLEEAAGRPVRVFMHHPPCDIGLPRMDRIKLEDWAAFAGIVDGHDVRHIFFGHVHRAIYVSWRGIACTALPGTGHQVPLVTEAVGAGFSIEPAAYGVVLVNGPETVVHMETPLDRHAPTHA